MPFRLLPGDPDLSAAMRRIALEEAARAQDDLANPDLDTGAKIHQARKRTKRLRGMLRLFRPALEDFSRELGHLRRASRNLSRLRDRDVLIATHDRLMLVSHAPKARYASVRAHLTRARNRVAAQHDPDAALARFGAEMSALSRRIPSWHLRGKDKRALRKGLERTLRDAKVALARAQTREDIEDLHEWRKRVKDHWYQCRLLTPVAPKVFRPRAKSIGALGKLLGEINDLDIYRHHLAGPEATGLDPERNAALRALADARIETLETTALARGAPLFAPRPKRHARLWARMWAAQHRRQA